MRQFLFTLTLLVGIALEPKYCASQSKEDTLCFTVPQVRNLLIAAKQKAVLEERVTILNGRIDTLSATIKLLNQRDDATVQGYELELKTMREERAIYQDQIKTFEKLLRREKRKRFFTAMGGALTTGAALYLFFTK